MAAKQADHRFLFHIVSNLLTAALGAAVFFFNRADLLRLQHPGSHLVCPVHIPDRIAL
jgi:hypothetical protein